MKEFTIIFKSGNDAMPDYHRNKLCEFLIMAGGITSVAQSIHKFLGKIFQGYYRDFYGRYMITAPKM